MFISDVLYNQETVMGKKPLEDGSNLENFFIVLRRMKIQLTGWTQKKEERIDFEEINGYIVRKDNFCGFLTLICPSFIINNSYK